MKAVAAIAVVGAIAFGVQRSPFSIQGAGSGSGFAFLAVELKTHAVVDSVLAERLDRPVAPGAVMHIATLAAALESGTVGERTGITCTRRVVVGAHVLTCTHPDRGKPLSAAEALADSCNVYFATVAGRLRRPAFDRALASLGLPLSDPRVPVAAAALGLDGIAVPPRALIDMMARVVAQPTSLPWKAETLAAVRAGLRAAATSGAAAALSSHGIDALAKIATTTTPSGGNQRLVVGVTPSSSAAIGFALLASSGVTAANAAAVVAERLTEHLSKSARASATARDTPIRPPARVDSRAEPVGEPGTIRVGIAREGGGYAVRQMPLEDYVAGVVAGEMARDSTPAALEALAITVRTFAAANPGRHRAEGFDLCDTTHCQVLRKATAATTRAATASAGRVLLDHGAAASIYYTASCGGHTERPSNVWPGAVDPPFLPARADDACEGRPMWTAEIAVADLARALRSGGFKGELRDVRIASRNDSGRAARLRLIGVTPDEISGQDLRTVVGRTLGWQLLKSTAFDLGRTSTGFRFSGHGSGHGVGMCVIGAARLGARGESASAILAHYFPGAAISSSRAAVLTSAAPAPPPDVVVSLPAADEGERDAIRELTMRARTGLAKRLGVAAPTPITLRFHPTVESYRRATGQPWFTAGATVKRELHFVPLAVLRDRGVLERAIEHELVHLMTEPALAGRPLWVREGAAAYFAGERTTPATGRAPCPTDDELRRPSSAGEMNLASSRAAACFAKQIAAGKKWTEVR